MIFSHQDFAVVNGKQYEALVRDDWKDILSEDLEDNFKSANRSVTVKVLKGRTTHFSYKPSGADRRIVVRRARRGGLVSILGSLYLSKARPFSELYISEKAIASGIATPMVVALRVTSVLPFIYTFTIVTEEIENALDLFTYVRYSNIPLRNKLLQMLAYDIKRLHIAGIYHSDLNLRNILVKENNSDIEIYFIDFDKAKIYPTVLTEKQQLQSISRLNRSVEKLLGRENIITRQDKIRFLRYYGLEQDKLKIWAKRCASTLWYHKLFWSIKGEV